MTQIEGRTRIGRNGGDYAIIARWWTYTPRSIAVEIRQLEKMRYCQERIRKEDGTKSREGRRNRTMSEGRGWKGNIDSPREREGTAASPDLIGLRMPSWSRRALEQEL